MKETKDYTLKAIEVLMNFSLHPQQNSL